MEQTSNARQQSLIVQDAFPHLNPAEREFLISGITPEEWDKEFAPPDGDEGNE